MRITLFDCLDSFTWNLVHDLERVGPVSVSWKKGSGKLQIGPKPTPLCFRLAPDCRKSIPSCWTC